MYDTLTMIKHKTKFKKQAKDCLWDYAFVLD